MQDHEALERMRHGEEAALETLVRRYTAYVMTVIRQIAVPPLSDEDVEEATADVFVTLWKTAGQIRAASSLKAYLAQIARNVARRKRKRFVGWLSYEDDVLTLTDRSVESVAAAREQTAILGEALREMEPTRRECVIRRYYYGETLLAIAKVTSLPLSTVKSHVYRGRLQLLKSLQEGGYTYEETHHATATDE